MGSNYIVRRAPEDIGIAELVRGRVKPASGGHPEHWHQEWQLVAVTKGDGWVRVQGTQHQTPGGSMFLIPPEAVHSNNVLDEGCEFSSMLIDAETVEAICASSDLHPSRAMLCRNPVMLSAPLTGRFASLHRALEDAPSTLARELALEEWMTNWIGRQTGQELPKTVPVHHPAARKAREFLWSYAETNPSLAELAKTVGLSRFELSRQFKSAFGMSPYAWQQQVRVQRGKALLKAGTPIGDAALDLGFCDQAHFSRVFRHVTGYTPGAYAAQFRNILQDPPAS